MVHGDGRHICRGRVGVLAVEVVVVHAAAREMDGCRSGSRAAVAVLVVAVELQLWMKLQSEWATWLS